MSGSPVVLDINARLPTPKIPQAATLPLPREVIERILSFLDRSTLRCCIGTNRSFGYVAGAFASQSVVLPYHCEWERPIKLMITSSLLRYRHHVRTLKVSSHGGKGGHSPNCTPDLFPNLRTLWLVMAEDSLPVFCGDQMGNPSCDFVDCLHYSTLILSRLTSPFDRLPPGFTMPSNGMLETVILSFDPHEHERPPLLRQTYTMLPASVRNVVFYYPLANRLLRTLFPLPPRYEPMYSPFYVPSFTLGAFADMFATVIAHSPEKRYTFLDINRWTPAFCGLPNSTPSHIVIRTVRNALKANIRSRLESTNCPTHIIDNCIRNICFISVQDYLNHSRPNIDPDIFDSMKMWDIRGLERQVRRKVLPVVASEENGQGGLVHMPRDLDDPMGCYRPRERVESIDSLWSFMFNLPSYDLYSVPAYSPPTGVTGVHTHNLLDGVTIPGYEPIIYDEDP